MAEPATLARPYANAVFELAKRTKRLDQWSKMLDYLAVACEEPTMARYLSSPTVTAEAKAYRLADVCGDVMNDPGRRFLDVLAANRRLELIREIREQFEARRAEEERILEVEVQSAYELSEPERRRLLESLKKRYEREIELTSRVDPSLLGGAIIRAGDTVIDGSVRGRLDRLAETLTRT